MSKRPKEGAGAKTKLDTNAILAKNPHVDRKIFEENQKKASEAKKVLPAKSPAPGHVS